MTKQIPFLNNNFIIQKDVLKIRLMKTSQINVCNRSKNDLFYA